MPTRKQYRLTSAGQRTALFCSRSTPACSAPAWPSFRHRSRPPTRRSVPGSIRSRLPPTASWSELSLLLKLDSAAPRFPAQGVYALLMATRLDTFNPQQVQHPRHDLYRTRPDRGCSLVSLSVGWQASLPSPARPLSAVQATGGWTCRMTQETGSAGPYGNA